MDRINTIISIYDQAKRIYDSDIDWELKYDLIFSEDISKRIFSLINLDYYDPDTSYEEDVRAFMNALEEKAEQLKRI